MLVAKPLEVGQQGRFIYTNSKGPLECFFSQPGNFPDLTRTVNLTSTFEALIEKARDIVMAVFDE